MAYWITNGTTRESIQTPIGKSLAAPVCVIEVACGSVDIVYVNGAMMKTNLALALFGMVLVTALTTTAFAASKTNRISVRYVPPKNPAHLLSCLPMS